MHCIQRMRPAPEMPGLSPDRRRYKRPTWTLLKIDASPLAGFPPVARIYAARWDNYAVAGEAGLMSPPPGPGEISDVTRPFFSAARC